MPAKSAPRAAKSKPPTKPKIALSKAAPKPPSKPSAPVKAIRKPVTVARKKPGPAQPEAAPIKAVSKQAQLIDILRSDAGATIAQMMKLTGWQPHTVRGTLSGALRKRLGLVVEHRVALDSGERVYRIVAPA